MHQEGDRLTCCIRLRFSFSFVALLLAGSGWGIRSCLRRFLGLRGRVRMGVLMCRRLHSTMPALVSAAVAVRPHALHQLLKPQRAVHVGAGTLGRECKATGFRRLVAVQVATCKGWCTSGKIVHAVMSYAAQCASAPVRPRAPLGLAAAAPLPRTPPTW